jgi:chemotaxis-related protein WspB
MLLLTLKVGPNRYAIDATRVIELVPRVELRSIPHAPSFLAGLLGYRGQNVPVIDLGSLFCSIPCRDCLSTRIILVNDAPGDHLQESGTSAPSRANEDPKTSDPARNPGLLGLIGEQVSELTYARSDQVVASPVPLLQAPFLGAIVQTEGGILQMIVVERIRETALGARIPDQEAIRELSSS